jgi:IMP dehydrogenase
VDKGRLTGIVTDRDLRLAVMESLSEPGLKVASVMTHDPVTVKEDTPLKDAAELISKNKFNALPVVSASGELKGVLTTTDILNGLVRALDAEKK